MNGHVAKGYENESVSCIYSFDLSEIFHALLLMV